MRILTTQSGYHGDYTKIGEITVQCKLQMSSPSKPLKVNSQMYHLYVPTCRIQSEWPNYPSNAFKQETGLLPWE